MTWVLEELPVSDVPETRWTKTPDGMHIAYQVIGSGPVDVVFMTSWTGNVEVEWEWPPLARFLRRLASFGRLIRLDVRGSGLSDSAVRLDPTLEAQAKDLLSVLDAAGSARAALVANNLAGLMAMFFAASYPDRVSALVLDGCYARLARADDIPWGIPGEVLEERLADAGERFGRGFALDFLAPSTLNDPEFVAGWARRARLTVSPAMGLAMARLSVETDVRPLLGAIRAPTLVLYRSGDRFAGKDHARYLAEHIPGATLAELPGVDNLSFVGDIDAVVGEIQEFLTGARHLPEFDRVLATVLFTDIVRSTPKLAEVGDHRWRELLDRHDELATSEIDRFRGRFVTSTGDGILATFDGPARAIRCARAITNGAVKLGLDVRSGLHTGEIEMRGTDVSGLAVHLAQRVCGLAGGGEVLVSRTVTDLVVGSGIAFEEHGTHELKGVPGHWQLFTVTS
jgi:class 3 adenylate cyclase